MNRILAIDPGNIESAYVIWNGKRVLAKRKCPNMELVYIVQDSKNNVDKIVIEQIISSYGNFIGKEVFETVFWSGVFASTGGLDKMHMLPRQEIKKHVCGSVRKRDKHVIQNLVERFAPGQKNYGKGTKKKPGFFFGFKADIWQAFAVAVTFWDKYK